MKTSESRESMHLMTWQLTSHEQIGARVALQWKFANFCIGSPKNDVRGKETSRDGRLVCSWALQSSSVLRISASKPTRKGLHSNFLNFLKRLPEGYNWPILCKYHRLSGEFVRFFGVLVSVHFHQMLSVSVESDNWLHRLLMLLRLLLNQCLIGIVIGKLSKLKISLHFPFSAFSSVAEHRRSTELSLHHPVNYHCCQFVRESLIFFLHVLDCTHRDQLDCV